MDPAVQKMIDNLQEKTGKKIDHWVKIVKTSGLEKHGEKMKLLKEKHGFTHGYANMVVLMAKEDSAYNTKDKSSLITKQYDGKESLYPIYEALIKEVNKFGKDIEIAPKKAYVSLRRKKQFALIQPSTKTRVDIGINLKSVEADEIATIAGSWNTMVSHRIKITEKSEVNKKVIKWLKEAYNQG